MSSTPTCQVAAEQVSAATWQEAIAAATGLLVALGVAEPRYIEACQATVKEFGPYIVLTPGLALAHARPEQGATGLGLAVARLDAPVTFGHETNDPVDLVFAFATPSDTVHIDMLRRVAGALGAGLATRLRQAPDTLAMRAVLEEVFS